MSLAHALLAAGIVLVGSTVQRALGIGLGLVSVPVLAVIVPERMPQTLLLLAMPLLIGLAWHERASLRIGSLGWVLAGGVVGAWVGGPLVAGLGTRSLQAVFGGATLLAVAMLSIPRWQVPVTPATQLLAGTTSGVMSTVAAMAGPPLALLYSSLDPGRLRATLSMVFLVGNVVGIASLGWAGRIQGADLALSGALLLPLGLGYAGGARLAGRIPAGKVRPAVVGLAGVGGVVLVTWAVLGVTPP